MVKYTCLGFLSSGPNFSMIKVYDIWNRVAFYQNGTLEGSESGKKQVIKYYTRLLMKVSSLGTVLPTRFAEKRYDKNLEIQGVSVWI